MVLVTRRLHFCEPHRFDRLVGLFRGTYHFTSIFYLHCFTSPYVVRNIFIYVPYTGASFINAQVLIPHSSSLNNLRLVAGWNGTYRYHNENC